MCARIRGALWPATASRQWASPTPRAQLFVSKRRHHTLSPAQDFASGYKFGQLLHFFQLQPDFDNFQATRSPDAMINNYTRLQVRMQWN